MSRPERFFVVHIHAVKSGDEGEFLSDGIVIAAYDRVEFLKRFDSFMYFEESHCALEEYDSELQVTEIHVPSRHISTYSLKRKWYIADVS